jgi:hypothetical protein
MSNIQKSQDNNNVFRLFTFLHTFSTILLFGVTLFQFLQIEILKEDIELLKESLPVKVSKLIVSIYLSFSKIVDPYFINRGYFLY